MINAGKISQHVPILRVRFHVVGKLLSSLAVRIALRFRQLILPQGTYAAH